MPTPLRWEKTEPNLFIVRYQTGADLEPALQSSLVQAVRLAARLGPTGIHFVLSDGIAFARPEVPRYWSEVAADRSVGLTVVAVSSSATLVRVAANAFRMASTVAGLPLTVAAFATEAEGSAWARKTLAQATPRSA